MPETQRPSGRPPCATLAEYVAELIDRLGSHEPDLVESLRALVGDRRARIVLDDEAVETWFSGSTLVVSPAATPSGLANGEGATDRATTLDLIDGNVEVFEALLDGRLDARATIDDAARMFGAIEILLDGAVRIPALQALAAAYRADPCRSPRAPHDPFATPPPSAGGIYPFDVAASELALLERLDLLPIPPAGELP